MSTQIPDLGCGPRLTLFLLFTDVSGGFLSAQPRWVFSRPFLDVFFFFVSSCVHRSLDPRDLSVWENPRRDVYIYIYQDSKRVRNIHGCYKPLHVFQVLKKKRKQCHTAIIVFWGAVVRLITIGSRVLFTAQHVEHFLSIY